MSKKISLRVILLVLILVLSVLIYSLALGFYSARYTTDSAHGSSSYGVNRTGLSSFGYSKGNCAHCHEQHASIGGSEPLPTGSPDQFLLFAPENQSSQNTNFCFQCHKSGSTIQSVTNYTYSANFGGGTVTFSNIYDAFNPPSGSTPSSHNLSDVLNYAVGRSIGFTSNNNACAVCHDPHRSEKNNPVTSSGIGGVKTAVRFLTDYQSNQYNLWGDENFAASGFNELMSDYIANTNPATDVYMAPYFVGGITFEPANNATSNGTNLPNFVEFCLECHGNNNVYSTAQGRNLLRIQWGTGNDEHGRNDNPGGTGSCLNPYVNCDNANVHYTLACTDCHEPHGSQNQWLLRTTVNGTNVSVPCNGCWLQFCSSCHTINQHTAPWNNNTDCYNQPSCHRHGQFF